MSDLISRQAAIEVLRNRWLKTRNYDGIGEDIAEECEIYLKTLPSAQPVRHGRWIEDGSFKYKHGGRNSEAKELFGTEWRTMRRIKCSLCNKITLVDDTILYEYCPHCGARLYREGEEHEAD